MKTSLLAIVAAALTAVFAYVDVAAAATGSSAFNAGQVAGKVFLAVLVVLVVVSVVRRAKARSNHEG
jgi:membrane protein implicated in regulation of membrane protease activity